MVHSKVFECFQEHLPAFAEKVETYFPNGKNSIRVRQKDGKEFIFSFNGEKTWRFETIDQFLAGLKGGKVHGLNGPLYFRKPSEFGNDVPGNREINQEAAVV